MDRRVSQRHVAHLKVKLGHAEGTSNDAELMACIPSTEEEGCKRLNVAETLPWMPPRHGNVSRPEEQLKPCLHPVWSTIHGARVLHHARTRHAEYFNRNIMHTRINFMRISISPLGCEKGMEKQSAKQKCPIHAMNLLLYPEESCRPAFMKQVFPRFSRPTRPACSQSNRGLLDTRIH